ncbi:MAG: FadR/GntR family transcriptional regulator [Bacillota bacterium]
MSEPVDYRLSPVDTVRNSEVAAERLVEMIKAQKLKPGDKLPSEQALAQALGISRATVREALSGLKAIGLIVSRSGKGNFVAEEKGILKEWDKLVAEMRSRSVFLDALEARKALEGEICYLAAERATEEQLAAIRAAVLLGEQVDSQVGFRQNDYIFHHSLALASGNRLFIRFIEECFMNLSGHYWDILLATRPHVAPVMKSFQRDHRRIYEAIAERNGAKARERMAAHIESVRLSFLKASAGPSHVGGGENGETS